MNRVFRDRLRRFSRSEDGNFALFTAILAPVLAGLVGGAIDFYLYSAQKKQLQDVADGAVLAAASEAPLEGWSQKTVEALVDSFVDANLGNVGSGSTVYSASVNVDQKDRRVSVTIDQDHYGYFVAGYFKYSPQIRVTSTAQASGSTNICVIGLHASDQATVSLDSNSELTAPNCAVYSNSSSPSGMKSLSNSVVTASLACSAGGFEGATKNYNKKPLTDCPVMLDPLSSRIAPTIPAKKCDHINLVLKDAKKQVKPGIFCGGLVVDGNSNVEFKDGTYIFKDGPFIVDSNSIINGDNAGLYFTGKNAFFHFKSNAVVNLSAPVTGELAGLLAFQDRASAEYDFTIESNFTRNLLGTMYLPNGNLIIKADNDVADESAYTAIVVKRLRLFSGPNLVLNTDYDDTTVPVPDGLGPSSGPTRLVH